jgi:hypothetical protein
MDLFKFILWLSAGVVIGWFASRMVDVEHKRNHKPKPGKVHSSAKS